MLPDVLDDAQRLRAARTPFALATVVAARQPTSAVPGARAMITADGRLTGWVGGHCAQPVVVHEALAALRDGAPRLVVLSPEDDAEAGEERDITPRPERPTGPRGEGETERSGTGAHAGRAETRAGGGIVRAPMRCAAQGELQIFVEPFLPRLELVVVGGSPVATALARLGAQLDFEVWACDPDATLEAFPDAARLFADPDELAAQLTTRSCVVVATFGLYDEQALQTALGSRAAYVGLIASQARLAAVRAELQTRGVPEDQVERLKRPLGLPGRALLPAEIAFSAMAELVQVRRGLDRSANDETQAPVAEAVDPICGMTVQVATARFVSRRREQTYYFCCEGCQERFERTAPTEAG